MSENPNARAGMLADIRRALGRDKIDADEIRALRQRMADPPRASRVEFAQSLTERFTACMARHAGSVTQLDSMQKVPGEVVRILQAYRLPPRLRIAGALQRLDWPRQFEYTAQPADIATRIAVSQAFAGIAETGSLVMLAGPDAPTTHNFVPEYHVVIVSAADLVAHQEDLWPKIRARGALPRTVNLISGPSRTGDVEQTIQLGAHGPRALHVLLITA